MERANEVIFSYLPLNQAYSVAQVFSHNKPYFHQPKRENTMKTLNHLY